MTSPISGMRRFVLACALLPALLAAGPAAAEDIDLYAGSGGVVAAPNVLFFLDNSSNWSASSQAWSKSDVTAKCNATYGTGGPKADATKLSQCLQYTSDIFGSDSSLVQGQVELRALKLVLYDLVCGPTGNRRLNAGLMLFNPNGTPDSNSGVSGYIRKRVAPLDSSYCTELLADLTNIDSKITTPDFKGPSSAEYGAPLYEAFKYFGGYTSPAGAAARTAGSPTDRTHFGPQRYGNVSPLDDPLAFSDGGRTTYKSPLGDNACGNNYIVLIGNTWPNQEYGTNVNATPNPTNTLLTRLGSDPGAQIYPTPLTNSDKSDVRYADEWAKFLYTADVSDAPEQQNIRMFTVDVYNRSADAKQGKLLTSMAATNGATDGYFAVGGDVYALVQAFKDILSKIAAVNSVFASASLPVSVNAQGTFLNQVFMGVFRPDSNNYQRWSGNLKQYKFAVDGNTLYLADANGKPAVDSQNTGFIQDCATSFWTTDSGTYWQTINGAQASGCTSASTSAYSDSPDGPMVERGGAAQRLRILGYANRNIRTCKDMSCTENGNWSLRDFNTTNVTSIGTLNSTDTATLVNWARGQDTGDGSVNTSGVITYTNATTGTRSTVHGEVVHSRPLAINYGTSGSDDVVVYYGAGDGMLHALSGNQSGTTAGNELWAFIAPEHWSPLDRVRTNSPMVAYSNANSSNVTPTPTRKTYFFDGSIGGYQERSVSTISKVWIFPVMRRGGNYVYGFDVTTKPGTSSQPSLLWKYGPDSGSTHFGTGGNNMGQSWSTPIAIRVKGHAAPYVVFGAGYDNCEDDEDPNTACASVTKGRGIVVMNAHDGPSTAGDFRFIDPGSGAGRFVADMTAVDINGDGYVDVLYAVDTRGNIWRINTSDPSASYNGYASVNDWPVTLVASVGQWGASASERRKFMYAPSVVVLGSQATILVGTGDREKPSSSSNAAQVVNRFYGIRDKVTQTASVTPIIGYGSAPDHLYNVTGVTGIDPITLAAYSGWYLNLSSTTTPYEQVVTAPLTIGGVTYFSTYQAKANAGSNTCNNLGTARAYQIDFQTGTAVAGLPLTQTFISQGIPPSPVGGVVTIDGVKTPFLIGGTAPTVLSPTKVVPKVKPNRKPVYRYQRIDG